MQDLLTDAWLADRATAILVTHDVPEAVRLADRVLLLEHGTVTLDLPHPAPHPRRARSAEAVALDMMEHDVARKSVPTFRNHALEDEILRRLMLA